MPIIRAQTSFRHSSGLPEDVVTNTLHFQGPADVTADNILDMIENFYTVNSVTPAQPLVSFYSVLLEGHFDIKLYNLDEVEPRVPFLSRLEIEHTTAGTALPSEVALCMSYQAAPASGEIQARRRGRIYTGPYAETANDDNAGRPEGALIGALRQAGADLLDAAIASVEYDWVVWSETAQDEALVAGGWVDNSWDTQRRRGEATTVRGAW